MSTILNPDEHLADICRRLADGGCRFFQVANELADAANDVATTQGVDTAIRDLAAVAAVIKADSDKHSAEAEILYGIYLLIGEMLLDERRCNESREWLEKAVCINESSPEAFHSLAACSLFQNDLPGAVRALENEITVAPGNYYSYMLLADVYTRLSDDVGAERSLCALLSRDSTNIRALHSLIILYRCRHPETDVALLRERIIAGPVHPSALDLSIWTFYMLELGRADEIHHRLAEILDAHPSLSIVHLLRAQVYGHSRDFSLKRLELIAFIRENHWSSPSMLVKLEEFGMVFGKVIRTEIAGRIASLVPGHAADDLLDS